MEPLLTEAEVAERLRVSLACLRRWRLEKRGPRFIKVGVLVRYSAEGLDEWFDSLPTGGRSSQRVRKSADENITSL
jgi:excisionase family DNA binding protein